MDYNECEHFIFICEVAEYFDSSNTITKGKKYPEWHSMNSIIPFININHLLIQRINYIKDYFSNLHVQEVYSM